jgi:hypothetical protein
MVEPALCHLASSRTQGADRTAPTPRPDRRRRSAEQPAMQPAALREAGPLPGSPRTPALRTPRERRRSSPRHRPERRRGRIGPPLARWAVLTAVGNTCYIYDVRPVHLRIGGVPAYDCAACFEIDRESVLVNVARVKLLVHGEGQWRKCPLLADCWLCAHADVVAR